MLKNNLPDFSLENAIESQGKQLVVWLNDAINKCQSGDARKDVLQNMLKEIDAAKTLSLEQISAYELQLTELRFAKGESIPQEDILSKQLREFKLEISKQQLPKDDHRQEGFSKLSQEVKAIADDDNLTQGILDSYKFRWDLLLHQPDPAEKEKITLQPEIEENYPSLYPKLDMQIPNSSSAKIIEELKKVEKEVPIEPAITGEIDQQVETNLKNEITKFGAKILREKNRFATDLRKNNDPSTKLCLEKIDNVFQLFIKHRNNGKITSIEGLQTYERLLLLAQKKTDQEKSINIAPNARQFPPVHKKESSGKVTETKRVALTK